MIRLFCEHEYKIISESFKKVYMGQITGNIKVNQKYLLYCPKCKKIKWFKEKEAKALLNKQEIEKQYCRKEKVI